VFGGGQGLQAEEEGERGGSRVVGRESVGGKERDWFYIEGEFVQGSRFVLAFLFVKGRVG
jgi:hypothetical protein